MKTPFKPEKMRHEVAVLRHSAPLRDAAPRELEEFWQKRHRFPRAVNAHWTEMGPFNFSGRATCLAAHPTRPRELWAGSAGGGLWRSLDGGDSWESCWPYSISQNIGAVAVHPDNADWIYCATGEGNFSNSSYPGSGIYSSQDGGFTWKSYLWRPRLRRMTSSDRDSMPRRVASISISAPLPPGNSKRLMAFGSVSNDLALCGGLYQSTRKGTIEFETFWSDRPYNCYSALYHPHDPDTLFAAVEVGGALNGIWVKREGKDWRRLERGLPHGSLCGRISLAISPTHPEVMWALVGTPGRRVLGVFRSNNGGESWKNMAGSAFEQEGQLAYNNTIAIHPDQPKTVIVGAQGLYRTTDGGLNWSPITEHDRALSPTRLNPRYVHPDHHAILMTGGGVLYSANDGGIARSEDLGDSWNQKPSVGMNTVTFYAIDVSPCHAGLYGGGAQDNGMLLAGVNPGRGLKPPEEAASNHFLEVLKGDGGYLICDDQKAELVFASTFSTETHRHDPGRPWTRRLQFARWPDISPPVPEPEKKVLGLTVMAIRPASRRGGPRELLLGTNRLWRSPDNGKTWTPQDSQFDGSAVTAIEVARANPAVVYVGTANGGIFRSRDGGHEWSADLAGPEIPNRVITQVETHPLDARHVVVVAAGTGRPSTVLTLGGQRKPFSSVFQSRDGGDSWENIDRGQLPRVVYHGLAFETHPPYRLFLSGDAGPWVMLADAGWVSLAGNLPSAVNSDLIYHHASRTITAGTYGRGIWRMQVPDHFEFVSGLTPSEDVENDLPVVEGYVLDVTAAGPQLLEPLDNTTFNHFPRVTEFTLATVPDATGYVVEAVTDSGFHRVGAAAGPAVTIEMVGANRYQWRAWVLLPGGRCSMPSETRNFNYLV